MSVSASSSGVWQDRFAAACDRLVHPAVDCPVSRALNRRLIGILLVAPFLLGGLISQTLYGIVDNPTLLALNCAIFASAWLATALVAATSKTAIVENALLVVATMIIGLAVSTVGLLKSPLVLLLLVPPFECWWLHRARGSTNRGWWASIAVCAVTLFAMNAGYGNLGSFSEQLWALPLVYAATMWFRFNMTEESKTTSQPNVYEAAASIAGAALFRVTRDGEVDYASRGTISTIGVPPALLTGTGLFERIHVTDRVEYMSLLAAVREDGNRRSADLRVRMAASDGKVGDYHSLRFGFSSDLDEKSAVFVQVEDCEEILQLRQAIVEARDKAGSVDTAKGRFLASVSHELRTPLNAIIGFADMLNNEMFGPFSDPRQKEYTELIGQSGNHLLSVVNAILDVSKIESGTYMIEAEPFAFSEAVEMCHSMMFLQARSKDIAFTCDVDKSLHEICADRRAVQQILINLVSNAIKFTPEGGKIEISADVRDDRLRFRVNDNGIGISAEDLENIGQPFMQVQSSYTRQFEGTGLGLSLVKGLVVLHEGELVIDSAPGCGTTVTVTLPIDGPKDCKPPSNVEPMEAAIVETRGIANGAKRKQA